MVTNGMEPRMRQREYVTKFGSRNKGFEFKSPSDEEDGARLYPGCLHELDLLDLYEEHETSKQKRSKHLYRCCCCCIYAEGDFACDKDDDDKNGGVKQHRGPALGLPVLSKCVPVVGQAYMALWVWQSFYSLWSVLGRELSEAGPIFKPMLFLFLRNIFATILLVMLVLWSQGCKIRSLLPRKRDVCLTLALGAASWSNQLLYIYGLRYTTATNAALLFSCIPMYAMVIGIVIGSQVWGKGCNCVKKFLGIFFCTGGAIFVILASDRAQDRLNILHSRYLYGNVLIWMATVAIAVYMHIQAPLSRRYSALQMTVFSQIVCTCGSACVMLFVGVFTEYDNLDGWVPELSFWGCLVYAVICLSMFNFIAETWAIRRSSATTAAMFTTLDFPNTAVLSKLILGERLTSRAVLGGIVITTGLLMTLSSDTITHDEEHGTDVEKTPLLPHRLPSE